MKTLFTKDDFVFNDAKYVQEYQYDTDDFRVRISKDDFCDDEVLFSNKIVNLYEENLMKIASFCVESDTFKMCYPTETPESIIEKLGEPIFKRMGDITLITYTNHSIDYDHILDVEIYGLYEEIVDVGIDG